MQYYSTEIEKQMQRYCATLSEKDKRRYAAIEAIKLEYGGRGYICELLGCDYKTLAKGLEEIQDEKILEQTRIRKQGGGTKLATYLHKGLVEAFFHVLAKHTAGSPVDDKVKWTNLSHREIAERLKEKGFTVSVKVVKKLLYEHNFRKRKALKKNPVGSVKIERNNFKK